MHLIPFINLNLLIPYTQDYHRIHSTSWESDRWKDTAAWWRSASRAAWRSRLSSWSISRSSLWQRAWEDTRAWQNYRKCLYFTKKFISEYQLYWRKKILNTLDSLCNLIGFLPVFIWHVKRRGVNRSWNVSPTCTWPQIDPLECRVLFSNWK